MLSNRTSESSSPVEQLNSFLRGEISAVETYRQAIEKLQDSAHVITLRDCMRSHEQRVTALTLEIRRLGGQPATGSGAWGTFAKLVEGGAKAFGEKAAIAALEEGEDHGRNDYRRDTDKLSLEERRFVQTNLLPEQDRTHRALSSLKHSMH